MALHIDRLSGQRTRCHGNSSSDPRQQTVACGKPEAASIILWQEICRGAGARGMLAAVDALPGYSITFVILTQDRKRD